VGGGYARTVLLAETCVLAGVEIPGQSS
jgi:hypothetical protein